MYSISEQGGYCKCCAFFARCWPNVNELGVLVNRPLTNYKKATEILRDHFASVEKKSHRAAMERAMTFLAVMEKCTVAIDQQLISK